MNRRRGRSDPDAFAREPFILGIDHNRVRFAYTGYYESYVRNQVAPADLTWAMRLLGSLTERQWNDAFRAGGYDQQTTARFVGTLRKRIRDGQALARRAQS